jgi:hypothetical protein
LARPALRRTSHNPPATSIGSPMLRRKPLSIGLLRVKLQLAG